MYSKKLFFKKDLEELKKLNPKLKNYLYDRVQKELKKFTKNQAHIEKIVAYTNNVYNKYKIKIYNTY